MVDLRWILLATIVAVTEMPVSGQDVMSMTGYRIPRDAQYLILAPRKVRPDMEYKIRISLYRLYSQAVKVRAVLSRDGDEYASSSIEFTQPTTKDLSLDVPEFVAPGVHKLTVQGLVGSGVGQPMFYNETEVLFDSKYVSLFIQTDHLIYFPEQDLPRSEGVHPMRTPWLLPGPDKNVWMDAHQTRTVNFRVVGVTPDLKPIYGTLTVYVVDAGGHVVRRWLQKQLNLGVFHESFTLTYPVKPGTWKIRVQAFGHIYEKEFQVEFFFHGPENRILEVNCTTPLRINNAEWGLIGQLYGEHLGGRPALGNATIRIRAQNENGNILSGEIEKKIAYFTNTIPFELAMTEIEDVWGRVAGKKLLFEAWIYDWFLDVTAKGSSATEIIQDGVVVKVIGNKYRTFKPEVPFTIYFAVMQRDNTSYNGFFSRQVEVSRSHSGDSTTPHSSTDKLIIPDDGIVRYTVKPLPGDKQIILSVYHSSSPSTKAEARIYRYFSPGQKYVSISTSTVEPSVNEYMVFTVQTNVFVSEVHYVIIGGGTTLLGDSLQMSSRQRTFGVALSRNMAPRARIVVYFMDDGEVVVDSLTFHVHDTRLFKASVQVNLGKDFSRDTIELVGRSYPGAYFMYSGIEYDMYERGADTFLTVEDVVRELATYDEPNQPAFEHVWWYNSARWDSTVYFPAPTNAMDALMTFNTSGLIALSDKNMTLQPDWFGEVTQCNRSLNNGQCPLGGCFNFNQTCDGFTECADGYDEAGCPPDEESELRPPDIDSLHRMSRFYSDVTWLWKTIYVMPNGRCELQVDVPEVTNPYVISGFTLHPDEGLSLVTQPAMHDTTRSFFMIAEAPAASQRGEQIGIRLSLFNYLDERLEVIVQMHGHPDYKFVMVEDFGYVTSYSPKLSGGDQQIMVLLEAGENVYVNFPIVPVLGTGTVNIRFSAISFYDRDEDEVTIDVSMDGVPNGDHTPYLVDLVNQGSVLIPDFDSPIPEMFWQPELPYHLYVPGSDTAAYQLFGSVVSPGFFVPHMDAENTLGIPDDSAEGYTYDFAINLQTLRYLQYSQALTDEAKTEALEYMKNILMRQFAYMEDDGGFKMFRRDSDPCVWVTAFIGKTLHSALASEWNEDLYIEVEIINQIAHWIVEKQRDSGAFVETAGVIYDRNMNPITVDSNGVEHDFNIPLTAYVTITLASLTRVTGAAKTAADVAKGRAAGYLATKLNYITDPYQMAITAYALQVAGHRDKGDAHSRLVQMRIVTEFVYWASEPIAENPTEIINTVSLMHVRDYFANLGNAVTATSFGLMLYLDRNEYEDSIPIMKWLQTQRNGLMRFSSTQDTLVALEALTEFALRETNRDIYQMLVTLESTMNLPGQQPWRREVHLNQTNFANLFTEDLTLAYGQMKAYAQGTGYAMLQMEYNQNVEKAWLVSGPAFESYGIDVEWTNYTGRNYSVMDARMCTRWLRPDISPVSGMTVFIIGIPTGYVVSRDNIERIYNAQFPGLRRVRFRNAQLITLWDSIPQTKTCFEFQARRWYPVANMSIQHSINIYEYAETGLQKNWLYESYSLHHLHICQVCGSYQCPYCAFYNAAPSLGISAFAAIFATIIALAVVWSTTGASLAPDIVT